MADLPRVHAATPAEPTPAGAPPAGTRSALSAIELLATLCGLFAVVTFAIWGFTAWPPLWNIVAGIGTPVVAILVWALFVSPRAVIGLHPFARALVELLVYAAATIAWWSAGQAWIGLTFGIVAVAVGLIAGRRRLA